MFADRRTAPPSPFAAMTTEQENPELLDALHERLRAEFRPVSAIEAHLVWAIAMTVWRAERAARLERAVLDRRRPEPAAIEASVAYTASQQNALARLLDLWARRQTGSMPVIGHGCETHAMPANDHEAEPGARAHPSRSADR